VGPNDYPVLERLLPNIQTVLKGWRSIYIITASGVIDRLNVKHPSLKWIDEKVFPFSIQMIHDKFKKPSRSGWYLQQLLKLYACIQLPDMLDDFVILDADLLFYKDVAFFEGGKIMFNCGTEYHRPYFEHMARVHPSLGKFLPVSGICHMMPMRRTIVRAFIDMIESHHDGKLFWQVFLDQVDPKHYEHSGASEYEMLFTFAHQRFRDDVTIRKLTWRNVSRPDPQYDGHYEACHWYCRRA
jgi:hypothetical protein